MMKKSLALMCVLGFASYTQPALAWLKFCNGTDDAIQTALAYWDENSCAESQGTYNVYQWWAINPGQCATTYGSNLNNISSKYYYGETIGGGPVWNGGQVFCIHWAAQANCSNVCAGPHRDLGLHSLNTGSYSNYTLNFVL